MLKVYNTIIKPTVVSAYRGTRTFFYWDLLKPVLYSDSLATFINKVQIETLFE